MSLKRCLLLVVFLYSGLLATSQDQWLLVGTYTNSGSYGIYTFRFHPETATTQLVDSIAVENPSYLSISSDGKYVYSIAENGHTKPGSVSAFAFDQKTGHLSFLNEEPSGGDHPCYVATNKAGNWVAVANYSGGSLSVLPVEENGHLQPPAQTIQHVGNGPVTRRQEKPHVHLTMFSPKEDFLFAADLGTDRILAYPFNADKRFPLDTSKAITIKTPACAGPRHIAFHPSLPMLYVIEELTGTVGVYAGKNNAWSRKQTIASDTISPLPDRGSADIHLTPDGKFLYTSNRGQANHISIYAVDAKTGLLTFNGTQHVLGAGPRNFTIDASGKYLLVANQKSNSIVCFKINEAKGLLELTGNVVSAPAPVCLKMIPVK
jgi:6-phosphogluconolactonase